jgi:hypothetical protein
MARPKKSISAEQVVKLARLGLTVTEIAEFLGVDRATLYRRFATEITKGQSLLNIKLRRLQLRAAERGNVAMLIFLGKVVLHQREFPDEQETPTKVQIIFERFDEDLGRSANQRELQDKPIIGE